MNRRQAIDLLTKIGLTLPFVPLLGCGTQEEPPKSTSPANSDNQNDSSGDSDNQNDGSGSDNNQNGGSDNSNAGDDCVIADAIGAANLHFHQITIPKADIEAPPADGKAYICNGAHSHTVTLSQADLTELGEKCEITATTTDGGHTHEWTIKINP